MAESLVLDQFCLEKCREMRCNGDGFSCSLALLSECQVRCYYYYYSHFFFFFFFFFLQLTCSIRSCFDLHVIFLH